MSPLVSKEVVSHLRLEASLLRRDLADLESAFVEDVAYSYAGSPIASGATQRLSIRLNDFLFLVEGVADALRPDAPTSEMQILPAGITGALQEG